VRKFGLFFIITLLVVGKTYSQQEKQSEKKYPKVELDNTEVRELRSSYNNQKYKIYVKFPRNYQETNKDYPVLYILDAETNFGGVSYIVQRLIKDKIIPEILLVGLAYGVDYDTFYQLRSRDLTPTVRNDFLTDGIPNPTGGVREFVKFIKNELFPFITENYNTQNEDRAVYGHSFGGLFGTYILLNHTQIFQKYLLLSPSLWWDNRALFRNIKNLDSKIEPTKLFMASGSLELDIDDDQIEFIPLLIAKKPDDLSVKAEIIDNETHRTIFGVGITRGLRFIYSGTKEENNKLEE